MANADSIRNETFFSLRAQYQVATNNTADQLFDDASCLLDLALSILGEQIEESETPKMWACRYMMEQAKAALNAGHSRSMAKPLMAAA